MSIKAIWRSFVNGLPIVAVLIIIGAIFQKVLPAQQATASVQYETGSLYDIVPSTHTPWFFIFIGWYIFSAMVSGMPEPEQDSSPWYIWAYRSFHILSASGTSFFQNKIYWPPSETEGRKERNATTRIAP